MLLSLRLSHENARIDNAATEQKILSRFCVCFLHLTFPAIRRRKRRSHNRFWYWSPRSGVDHADQTLTFIPHLFPCRDFPTILTQTLPAKWRRSGSLIVTSAFMLQPLILPSLDSAQEKIPALLSPDPRAWALVLSNE